MTLHLPNKNEFALSDAVNDSIFQTSITKLLKPLVCTQENPTAIFTGAQPGAGKTALQKQIFAKMTDAASYAFINGDDLRGYHTRLEELNRENDVLTAYFTDIDTGKWVEKSIDYMAATSTNLIIEGTLRRPETTIGTAKKLAEQGYTNELHVVAANELYSRIRIASRYLWQKAQKGHGRYTLKSAHDASYENLPASVKHILDSNLFSRVVLYDIEYSTLFDSTLDGFDFEGKITPVFNYVRTGKNQQFDKLLADAQQLRELAEQLNCESLIIEDLTGLISDILRAME
jgi:UDP-N-acetylglucosamine kinase